MTTYRASRHHAELGPEFFDPVHAADFPQTILRYRNQTWAKRIGLDKLTDDQWIAHFGRFEPLEGSFPQPLALRYHGHQFRSYNPYLGDGRGFLFAQLHDLKDQRLLDLGTKGSGQTPWSREADGRLTLKGGVRELLATEMLEALGVDTSKTLSMIETGEQLYRSDEPSPARSCVLVRLSHSHIRIGTFQRYAYLKETDNIVRLLDHTIKTYMPSAWRETLSDRAAAFLHQTSRNVARTAARWMTAGFVHGVLNTDNINVTGESFDYGPWRFLPHYDPAFTAAYFDETGLYSYGRQPEAIAWNLLRLGECLLPICDRENLEQALADYWVLFEQEFAAAILERLGLEAQEAEMDRLLAKNIFDFLLSSRMPFEQFFFDWRGGALSRERATRSPVAQHYETDAFKPLHSMMIKSYRPIAGINIENAYFSKTKPCTLLIDEVEHIWSQIELNGDWSPLNNKISEIRKKKNAYNNFSAEMSSTTSDPAAT